MAFVKTVELTNTFAQKAPTMSGSDRLHQDRLQRENLDRLDKITLAIREIQTFLATLP